MQRCPCSVKCMGTTWGISGDVCIYMYIVLFCTYANHVSYVISLELTTGLSAFCHRLYVRLLYLATFLLVRMDRTACYHNIIHPYCIKKRILKINCLMRTYDQKCHFQLSLNRLHLSSCQNLLSTFDSHKFLILIQNLGFNHLLESLRDPLPLWYSEFPRLSHGTRPKHRIS
jgi:hypothetical protein